MFHGHAYMKNPYYGNSPVFKVVYRKEENYFIHIEYIILHMSA